MKQTEKVHALVLRGAGFSIKEIAQQLRVSKSTVSLWVRNTVLSKQAQTILDAKYTAGQLAAKITKESGTQRLLQEAATLATDVVSKMSVSSDARRVLCAMLYWCEGAKSTNDGSFVFTNSDPDLVRAFLSLLRDGFRIDENKFRVVVHLHEYHNKRAQLLFWSKVTKIPLPQFSRPYLKAHSGKQVREGYAGCASIRYHDVRISRQIQAIARAFMQRVAREGL